MSQLDVRETASRYQTKYDIASEDADEKTPEEGQNCEKCTA